MSVGGWAVLAAAVLAGGAAQANATRESFDLAVTQPPGLVIVEGRRELVFELHLTNFSGEALTPSAIRILDAGSGAVLRTLAGPDLAGAIRVIGPSGGREAPTLAPGARAVLYLEVELGKGPLPHALVQEVEYRAGDELSTVKGGRVALDATPRAALGPPLRGGPWVAIHRPDWPRGHRRVIYTVDGKARIPGRFAIDWVKVDAQGRIARSDPDRPGDALGYGADVLAVADGVVPNVRSDVTEAEKVSANGRHALADEAGNFVALKLPDGRLAIYEHLKPGSLRVRAGDHVRRGQVIAALGFTGSSTGPHLHLHVADTAVPVAGEGLPYAFSGFTLLGHYDDISSLGSKPWTPRDPNEAAARANEHPGYNVVVSFPG